MKITAKSAPEFLRAPDKSARGVLLYGPDSGLVRERLQLIMRTVLGPTPDAFAQTELTDDQLKSDPARLADEWGAMSLMGGRRVITIREASDRLASLIEEVVASDSPHFLVAYTDELGPRSSLRLLFEGNTHLAALPCYKDEAMDIQGLLRERLSAKGIQFSRDVADYLVAQLGNDRYITYSELDKILLYLGEETVLTLEAAQAIVGHNRDIGLDVIAMATADRNPARLESQLTQAFREGMQPVAILRATLRHFHKLYSLRAQVDGGMSAEAAVQAIKPPVFFRNVPVLTRQVQSWPMSHIVKALGVLNEAELACKRGDISPNTVASQVLFRLAGSGKNPVRSAA